MKRKENTGKSEDRRRKTEDGSKRQSARSRGQRAEGQEQKAVNRHPATGIQQRATRKNSTVYNKTRSSAFSPRLGGKASRLERKGDQKVRLTPVTIEISREEAAITACGFLRFFNN